jgi:hypothetical protein
MKNKKKFLKLPGTNTYKVTVPRSDVKKVEISYQLGFDFDVLES